MQKGFTIIELIVVIAIIAILAAIVLLNVTQYINKGKDAAIKSNFYTIFTNSALYFNTNYNYINFLSNAGYTTPAAAAQSENGGTPLISSIDSTDYHFCACSTLKVISGDTYCIDDTGYKKETGNACSVRCTAGVCSD